MKFSKGDRVRVTDEGWRIGVRPGKVSGSGVSDDCREFIVESFDRHRANLLLKDIVVTWMPQYFELAGGPW